MRGLKGGCIVAAVALVGAQTVAVADVKLGDVTFGTRPTVVLRSDVTFSAGISRSLTRMEFVGEIGGVAFGGVAKPDATRVRTFDLRYDPTRDDGHRAVATINGVDYTLEVPDWILGPSAAFASSDEVALTTAFSQYSDGPTTREDRCDAFIFSYHPAIASSLIGLRVLQADLYGIIGDAYADLPRDGGTYLLGTGETAPSPSEVATQATSHADVMSRIEGLYQSYILTDADVRMTFRPHDGVVELAGVPTYRLWRDGLTASGKPTDPIDFATAYIVEFEAAGHDVAWAKNRARKLAKDLAHSRRISNDKLRELADTVGSSKNDVTLRLAALAMMEEAALAQQVVLVPPAENPLSDSAVIAASNPTVYHAVTAFAQTAAFLRYVRTSYPRAWRSFRSSTAAFEAPAVTVPTQVARPDAATCRSMLH